jgi:uncharacterized membrane protein
VAAVIAVGWASYAGAIVPLSRARRTTLSTVRAVTLLLVVACLLRPLRVMPPEEAGDTVVPILVDVSRSMRLTDADGRSRMDAAHDVIEKQVVPRLRGRFRTELWTFGNALAPAKGTTFTADQGRSDLSAALRGIRERYRDRKVAAMVVISDGGDTGRDEPASVVDASSVPVYTVGVGRASLASDFEVIDVSAGEATLSESSIDLTVAAISRGSSAPFDVRVLENGRPIDVRKVTPAASGSPVHEVFTVSPARETPTLYTVEIPSAANELVLENNRRSVLVEPPGRRRRILFVEGAPGFEHTFVKRAMSADQGIELDSVVRKGRDGQGHATFFVQSNEARAPRLASGFPQDRETLYEYDALVLANVESDLLTRAQLDLAASFVNDRGGGLLVFGAKSFEQQGLVGTPVEEVLPLTLTGRGTGVVRASARGGTPYQLSVTADGESHPIMRIGTTAEDTAKRWAAIPALANATALGAPRPGAQVLALVRTPDGSRPLVAIQRYGQGRSMLFTGEASWRWRMQLPSTDRTFELFWRQAGRWLTGASPDAVSIAPLGDIAAGDASALSVDVRNAEFAAVPNADVRMRVTVPGGEVRDIRPTLVDPRIGRYAADMQFDRPGIYRVAVEARRASMTLGASQRFVLVGGTDREMTDPRLNEDLLRRVARASGGQYVPAADASRLPDLLATVNAEPPPPRLEELWHNPFVFAALIALLAAEWVLRRRWGLR